MARSALHEFAPRIGDLEPEVKRAWLLNKGMVISFTRFSVPHERQPEDETRIAVVDPARVQEALTRAHAEFGDASAEPFPSDAMLMAFSAASRKEGK